MPWLLRQNLSHLINTWQLIDCTHWMWDNRDKDWDWDSSGTKRCLQNCSSTSLLPDDNVDSMEAAALSDQVCPVQRPSEKHFTLPHATMLLLQRELCVCCRATQTVGQCLRCSVGVKRRFGQELFSIWVKLLSWIWQVGGLEEKKGDFKRVQTQCVKIHSYSEARMGCMTASAATIYWFDWHDCQHVAHRWDSLWCCKLDCKCLQMLINIILHRELLV